MYKKKRISRQERFCPLCGTKCNKSWFKFCQDCYLKKKQNHKKYILDDLTKQIDEKKKEYTTWYKLSDVHLQLEKEKNELEKIKKETQLRIEYSKLESHIDKLRKESQLMTLIVSIQKESKDISKLIKYKDDIVRLHVERLKRQHTDLKQYMCKHASYLSKVWSYNDCHLGFSVDSKLYKFSKIKDYEFAIHITFTIYLDDINTISDFQNCQKFKVGVGRLGSYRSFMVDADIISQLLKIKDKIKAFEFVMIQIVKTTISK